MIKGIIHDVNVKQTMGCVGSFSSQPNQKEKIHRSKNLQVRQADMPG